MTEAVQVALISACATCIVAFLALVGAVIPLLVSTRRAARKGAALSQVVKEEIKNDHNLRDEQDERHAENAGRIGKLERRVGGMEKNLTRIVDHLGIETTIQPPRKA